ncbi:hypothetical protein RN51_01751 [Microbacterium oxydans]|uniref:Uncharacterized protein n=1 Tax=Microbacterium oxydans TaxID=82380 RepID=A0A0F0KPQ7_9MICO|nr:hypothetical protein [Microbacterium oxydans]KJL22439.1 hypothetical protein RN51_01751 [Microbacterium oxydans]
MDPRRQARGHRLGSEGIVTELLGSGRVIERDNDEDTYGWRPDGSATVIEFARATEEVADNVADALLASLRSQGQLFLDDEDASDDLSREARIELALDFVDDNRYGGWEGTWFPMPAGGALLAAEVRLGWSEV